MKTRFIQIILIMSLFFNIAHDAVIAVHEHDVSESISEYILEQQQSSDCGNMGESHHLFHLAAILSSNQLDLHLLYQSGMIGFKSSTYQNSLLDRQIRPPIA